MAEICVRAYNTKPNNLAMTLYGAILNLFTYLKALFLDTSSVNQY